MIYVSSLMHLFLALDLYKVMKSPLVLERRLLRQTCFEMNIFHIPSWFCLYSQTPEQEMNF